MNVNQYLERVAYIGPSKVPPLDDEPEPYPDCYYSKFDDSYITQVGKEDNVQFLADREITDELTRGVGFSPKENKWYGWSHRAIFGFGIGSTCKKGDCHYRAANIEDEIEAAERFWDEESHEWTKAELKDNGTIHVSWEYGALTPNKKLHNTIGGCDWHYDPNNFGRGEWVAKTMEDAKQMAIDFNEGVS